MGASWQAKNDGFYGDRPAMTQGRTTTGGGLLRAAMRLMEPSNSTRLR
jgi:hypothetical protein